MSYTKPLDMLIVALPVLDLQYPPAGPAILKGCLQNAGYTAQTLDFNMDLLRLCGSKERFYQVQYNFENVSTDVLDSKDPVIAFFDKDHDLIRQWVDLCIEQIVRIKPRWLALSVFTYKSHKAALLLLAEIRRRKIKQQISMGGRGASAFALGPDHSEFKHKIINYFGPYPQKNFGQTMQEYGLIDKLIEGDGEQAIIDLVKDDMPDRVMANVADIDLESVPFVDFGDYNLKGYDFVNEPILPITGSKGCVRKCRFCDIPVLWPKYKWRSGKHIAEEMIHLYNKHGVRKFYLTDSLVNGSLKAFTDFTKTLAEYNTANPDKSLKWVGQYITRKMSPALNDEYYDRLKASGGEGLTIGVESGSDAVREHMKKQFRTVDVDHEIAEFDKRGIVCVLLFFSCYPTETWQDFLDTADMLMRYRKYCANGTVYKLTLGTPYTHHPDTPLWLIQDEIGLESEEGSDILWRLKSNPDLTFYERVRRRLILQEVTTALKLPMSRNTPELNQLTDSLRLHGKKIKRYFGKKVPIETLPDHYDLTPYDNLLMPLDLQEQCHEIMQNNKRDTVRILLQHQEIKDDIKFDNDSYTNLKQLLLDI